MQLERVERSNPLDTNPEGTWRYLTLNFEDLNQVQHYGQIPHARGKLSSNYTPLNNYATPHESIRRFHRLSGYVNAIDSQQVYIVAVQLTKTTQTNMTHFSRHYYEYSCYFLEKPSSLCASELASIVVFKIATPIATQLSIHYNDGGEEIQRQLDHTSRLDLAYIAANFGKNRLSLLLLNILTTDRPAELHFELNRGSGLCHRMRNANFLLG